MRPNTMNKYGAVLDDFGLETMLDKLMEGFIRPISKGGTYLPFTLVDFIFFLEDITMSDAIFLFFFNCNPLI